jgi:hypothetical protein
MDPKRLHVHSVPLILLAIAVTVVSVASVSNWRVESVVTALLRPAVRLESTERGFVQVVPNSRMPDEQPGASADIDAADKGVLQATQAADSIGLQMALDQATKP